VLFRQSLSIHLLHFYLRESSLKSLVVFYSGLFQISVDSVSVDILQKKLDSITKIKS
jgi:hypothetical protein